MFIFEERKWAIEIYKVALVGEVSYLQSFYVIRIKFKVIIIEIIVSVVNVFFFFRRFVKIVVIIIDIKANILAVSKAELC